MADENEMSDEIEMADENENADSPYNNPDEQWADIESIINPPNYGFNMVPEESDRYVEMIDSVARINHLLSKCGDVLRNAIQFKDGALIQHKFNLIMGALERTCIIGIPYDWYYQQKIIGLKCQNDGELHKDRRQVLQAIQTDFNLLANNINEIYRTIIYDNYQNALLKQTEIIVAKSFIVVDQPQICFKERRFDVSLRLLMSHAISDFGPVTVNILTEKEAREQRDNLLRRNPCQLAFNLLFTIGDGAWLRSGDELTYNIREIKNMNKMPKLGAIPVPETKYFLMFSTNVKIFNRSVIEICTLSMPIVFITNNCQEVEAYGTIFWNNLLSEEDGIAVEWTRIEHALKVFFRGYSNGCELNTYHLSYLRQKAFGINPVPSSRTFQQLCKLNISQRSSIKFSFWRYFFEAAKLAQNFTHHWKNNFIHGFIERSIAEKMILRCDPGTFLIRFTDSISGNITIAQCILTGGRKVVGMSRPRNKFEPNFDGVILGKRGLISLLDVERNIHKKEHIFIDPENILNPEGYENS